MTPYLFGIDLDGTLLSPAGDVTDRTRAAIHAVLAAGHKICFSTGRNGIEASTVFAAVGHEGIANLVSGALVVDTRDGRIIRRGHMNAQLAAELCQAIEDVGELSIAYQDRTETGLDYIISGDRPIHPSQHFWISATGQRAERHPTLATFDHTKTLRISAVTDYAGASRVRQAITERFANRVYIHSIDIASEKAEIIELFDPAVNKWQGLLLAAGELGVDPANIVAFGDDTNDLPMIRQAPLGVAMGNARQVVKDVAKRVIRPNSEDGLAVFLEELLAENR